MAAQNVSMTVGDLRRMGEAFSGQKVSIPRRFELMPSHKRVRMTEAELVRFAKRCGALEISYRKTYSREVTHKEVCTPAERARVISALKKRKTR